MIITPARFEDMMREADTPEEAVSLMAETLDSMGYSAGINIWTNKIFKESQNDD